MPSYIVLNNFVFDKKNNEMRFLILCTGNSCRSQMAEGFLKSFEPHDEIFSAGTNPTHTVHPKAIRVMKEVGIDISENHPESIDLFLGQNFDYVITVCDGAKETCPTFTGNVNSKIHIGYEDPAEATGTEDEILSTFRKIRDKIDNEFLSFSNKI